MPLRALNLLLVEPQSIVRSTVVAVARELHLPRVDEASTVAAAAHKMAVARYDGLLLSMDEQVPAMELLRRLRASETATPADLPVIVMVGRCDAELALAMKQLNVTRVVLKPFKVKTLLRSIEGLARQVLQQEMADPG